MRFEVPFVKTNANISVYDEIYMQSWQAALKECERKLEKKDYRLAMKVKSLEDFDNELKTLVTVYSDDESARAIKLIIPTLYHYETFAQKFVDMMANPVETSLMWGLLFLVFKLSLGGKTPASPISSLSRISVWLQKIGHKLRASNDCSVDITDLDTVKEDTVEINKEIVVLWLNVIMTFRSTDQAQQGFLDERAWKHLQDTYHLACHNIEEAAERTEKVAQMAEKQARAMKEMGLYQRLLSLENSKQEGASLPCNTLPVAQNHKFYGREDILNRLNQHLRPTDVHSRLSSIALYGLGGVGKTQTALAFAYSLLDDLDAVLWISSEDTLSVQQSFSRAALNALKLERAHPQAHQENMVLVLAWLQKTSAKWLLIFDNVDSHEVINNCWPASKHGAVLVTTRDIVVATLPIDTGLEVNEFEVKEGAEFLLRMTPSRRLKDNEEGPAEELAKELGGLPLALNQMAALINARNYTIADFGVMYSKYANKLHKQKKSGWKYLGYEHALDTVFELSFANLEEDARACLGVLSFLSADSVPSAIFTLDVTDVLPSILEFCEDDFRFDEALEQLRHHALVRKNIEQDSLRMHRLVQSEYRARMDHPQEKFDAATELLLDKFPSERSNRYDDDEWLRYEKYIPQVLALMRNYNDSQKQESHTLKPNMHFVMLLVNAANAIHDNDTANNVPGFLDTAESSFKKCPEEDRDALLWAFLLSLKCMYHLGTAQFVRAEEEMMEGLNIRLDKLSPDDLLLALSYSWLGMAVGGQERYDEGLDLLLKAGKILDGPAGELPTRRMVWGYNISRNYYCMGRFDEAEEILGKALGEAKSLESWYMQVYGHLTFTSLRTRMGRLDDAKTHVDTAKEILETSGTTARFSWLGSYCAYRAGDVALRQGRVPDAIDEADKATTIGRLTRVPTSLLARCTHKYSQALAADSARQEESEVQRREARKIRSQVPGGGGDLDDESDEAFERLVKMDHR